MLLVPPTLTVTLTAPTERLLGTVTVIDVLDHDITVACVEPKLTVLDPCDAPKFVPVMVMDDPGAPEVGLMELMVGALVVDEPVVSAIVALCVIAPSVPVIEIFVVPAGVLACAKKLTTLVPLALSEDGEKLALTPVGNPLALRDTLPVSPPTNVIVIVLVGFEFGGTETAAGDTEMVKSGSAVTFRVSVVLLMVVPLVPVTVTVAVPTVAVDAAVNVSVLPVEPVTEVGLKLAVTPAGRPLIVKSTAAAKPLTSEIVTLVVAFVPCSTDTPVAAIVKPGVVLDDSGGYAFATS